MPVKNVSFSDFDNSPVSTDKSAKVLLTGVYVNDKKYGDLKIHSIKIKLFLKIFNKNNLNIFPTLGLDFIRLIESNI